MKKYTVLILILITVLFSCKPKKVINKKIEKPAQKSTKQISATKNPFKKIRPFKFTKGIYLTAYTVNSKKFYPIIQKAKDAGINTIVFDIKNMNGDVFFTERKSIKYLSANHKPIVNIGNTVKFLHKNNMRAVARIVMFHDMYLAKRMDELRPKTKSGKSWQENRKKKAWLDSSNPNVQNYLLSIIKIVAQSGVDEIQLDYIRFPTQGNQKNVQFYFQKQDISRAAKDSTYIKRRREDIIANFLKRVKKICVENKITLAGDVFAITAWQRKRDIFATGQNIKRMTKYLNFIHPMIYSSHFSKNFAFRKDAYNEPYYIVFNATYLTVKSTDKNCKVVPYIQANSWKVHYTPDYIYSQIQAVKDAGGMGYILWNASNKYDKTLKWLKNKKM